MKTKVSAAGDLRYLLAHSTPRPWRNVGSVHRNGHAVPLILGKPDSLGGQPVVEVVGQTAPVREADAALVTYLVNNADVFVELVELAELSGKPAVKAIAALVGFGAGGLSNAQTVVQDVKEDQAHGR